MLLFPEVQRAAHAELDRVLGIGRLPEIEDERSLPYVKAVMLEVLRQVYSYPSSTYH